MAIGRQPHEPSVASLTSHDKRLAQPLVAEPINKFAASHEAQMFFTRPIQSKFRVILKMKYYVTNTSASRSSKLLLSFIFAD
jgi:hypothetical protein